MKIMEMVEENEESGNEESNSSNSSGSSLGGKQQQRGIREDIKESIMAMVKLGWNPNRIHAALTKANLAEIPTLIQITNFIHRAKRRIGEEEEGEETKIKTKKAIKDAVVGKKQRRKRNGANREREMSDNSSIRSSSRLRCKKSSYNGHHVHGSTPSGSIRSNPKCFEAGCCGSPLGGGGGGHSPAMNGGGGGKRRGTNSDQKEGGDPNGKKMRKESSASGSVADNHAAHVPPKSAPIAAGGHDLQEGTSSSKMAEMAMVPVVVHEEEESTHELLQFIAHLIEDNRAHSALELVRCNFDTFSADHPPIFVELLLLSFVEICARICGNKEDQSAKTTGKYRKAVEIGRELKEIAVDFAGKGAKVTAESRILTARINSTLLLLVSVNEEEAKRHEVLAKRHQIAQEICEVLKPIVANWGGMKE